MQQTACSAYFCAHAQKSQNVGLSHARFELILEDLDARMTYVVFRSNPTNICDGKFRSHLVELDHSDFRKPSSCADYYPTSVLHQTRVIDRILVCETCHKDEVSHSPHIILCDSP